MVSLFTLSIIVCNGSPESTLLNKTHSIHGAQWALSLSIDLDPYYAELASINRTFCDLKENVITQIERTTQHFVGEPSRNDVVLGSQRRRI